jgi:hypothetical protein
MAQKSILVPAIFSRSSWNKTLKVLKYPEKNVDKNAFLHSSTLSILHFFLISFFNLPFSINSIVLDEWYNVSGYENISFAS